MRRIAGRIRSASGRPEDAGRLDGLCDAMNDRCCEPLSRWSRDHAGRGDAEYPPYRDGYLDGYSTATKARRRAVAP